jgi:hypothetical protein
MRKVSNDLRQVGQCGYCGKEQCLTRDHVPPRNLFPGPRSADLITVPCCEQCRTGWSDDDEYFRTVVVNADQLYGDNLAAPINDAMLRSLSKARKRRFSQMIIDSICKIPLETDSGIYLGHAPALKFDQDRVNRVSQRIVRGLFFHEKGYPIPLDYEVIGLLKQFGMEPLLETLRQQGIKFPTVRVIQSGVFAYTFRATTEDPNTTMWLALFYQKLPFVGFTGLPEQLRTQDERGI